MLSVAFDEHTWISAYFLDQLLDRVVDQFGLVCLAAAGVADPPNNGLLLTRICQLDLSVCILMHELRLLYFERMHLSRALIIGRYSRRRLSRPFCDALGLLLEARLLRGGLCLLAHLLSLNYGLN